jgi:hypothetical protein
MIFQRANPGFPSPCGEGLRVGVHAGTATDITTTPTPPDKREGLCRSSS